MCYHLELIILEERYVLLPRAHYCNTEDLLILLNANGNVTRKIYFFRLV